MDLNRESISWIDYPIGKYLSKITLDKLLIGFILLLVIISRLYNLDLRVMSHDEVNHVVPAYDLYSGRGYRHDPVSHGPLQFHLMAFSYFLFGDNDFSSRLPHALFSIMTVAFLLIYFRDYLGKTGSLIAGILFLISPFMLFYGRYARNEALVAFLGILLLFGVLKYIDCGQNRFLFLLTIALALHFTSKETAYIYTAQLLIYLAILTLREIIKGNWSSNSQWITFIIKNSMLLVIIFGALISSIILSRKMILPIQAIEFQPGRQFSSSSSLIGQISFLSTTLKTFAPILFPLMTGLGLIVFLKSKLKWKDLRNARPFNLLILVSTLVLPLLSAFPVNFAGFNPIEYTDQQNIIVTMIYLTYLVAVSAILGTIWNLKNWWKFALVFYIIFIIFYSTFFTNIFGILTGFVGSLGYWIAQQDINRGSQPLYYYVFLQLPFYEYLAIIGTVIAAYFGISKLASSTIRNANKNSKKQASHVDTTGVISGNHRKPSFFLSFFIYWLITSLLAYTFAGEKMPWLTVHICLPLLLCASWGFGRLIDSFQFNEKRTEKKAIGSILIISFLLAFSNLLTNTFGNHPPFQGKTQVQIQATNYFLFSLILATAIGFLINKYFYQWGLKKILHLGLICAIILLGLTTTRTAFRASFINYDYPTEFLVYAHAAPGPKEVLAQVEEISRRITGGLDIKVGYDNHALYPYWWYFRNFPNRIGYMETPTRNLEEAPLIIAGQANYGKIEPIVRDNYYVLEYMRLWWPNQDYFNLTWERIINALTSPDMRQALFNIWFDRDYSLYAEVTNNPHLTIENWLPSEKMRFYIRKDIAAKIWEYGTTESLQNILEEDPYQGKINPLMPTRVISGGGNTPGELDTPRGIAFATDGSIYVADSKNHRIQHFSESGELLHTWGSFASIAEGNAPGGTFYEPWDIAIGPAGNIYVTDTWNHRIQKFTSNGKFIKMWGYFAQGVSPKGFWGPRGITINKDGLIFVTDTGNKRIVVFDKDGNDVTQFGTGGLDLGQFDEPVGLAFDQNGYLYTADTWNRRVQVFQPSPEGIEYSAIASWDIDGWYGQSLNNKPFLTIGPTGNVLVTDPESSRILEFSSSGEFLRGWEILSLSEDIISQPVDLVFDIHDDLWVSDASSNMILIFTLP
ncbi:MAG TPA: TIGR03663 family protein [Anaerolineae bacterium]|nr:TIGR03663 family protein [Anaerolineae bacterium]